MNSSKAIYARSQVPPEKFRVLLSGLKLVVMTVLIFANWNNSTFAVNENVGRLFLVVWAVFILWDIATEFAHFRFDHLMSVGLGGILVGIALAATNWSQFSFIQWPIGWLTIVALVLVFGRFRMISQPDNKP